MSDSPRGSKRALLIAINEYNYEWWKLDGCGNDVLVMEQILTRQFGFPAENVNVLRNQEATRSGILAALEGLVSETGEDDIVVIYYAGHGSQMTCREKDEPDGFDETLVPYDSGRDPDENRDITDDELHLFLQRLGEKTSYTTLIFDCCHSGTITRDAFGTKVRAIPNDTRPADELPPSPIGPEPMMRSARNPGPSGWLSLSDKYVLIAGCADEEKSAEKRVVVGDTEIAHGALTWYLTEEIRKAGPGTTYRDVFEGISGRVTANCAQQHPQMEGRLDRELFGVRDITPMRYVRVLARSGETVTLGAGAAHGMTVRSRWGVVPAGTAEVTDETERLGEVEIVSVGAVESEAKVLAETAPDAIVPGARAIETAHSYGELRLRCEVVGPAAHQTEVDALRKRVEASLILAAVDEGAAADVRVYLLEPRDDPAADAAETPVPQLGALAEPTWVAVGEQGEVVLPLKPAGETAVFVDNLEKLARYRQALALSNPGSGLAAAVTMEFFRVLPDGSLVEAEPEAAGGQIVFEEGDVFELRVTNRHSERLYVNFLDFDPAGEIKLQYPPPGAHDAFAPGEMLKFKLPNGTTRVPQLRAKLPEKFPLVRLAGEDAPIEGTEVFKLFVTTQPADFSFLAAEAYRSADPPRSLEGLTPLEALMRTATGRGMRSAELVIPDAGPEWATVEKSYVTRRKTSDALKPGGEPLDLGAATITSPGLEGEATVHPWRSQRAAAAQMVGGPLTRALDSTRVEPRQTIEIAQAREVGTAMRSTGDGEPAMELELRDPGADFGQMVLATNEAGLLTWHFAEPDDEPATRSVDGAGPRSRRYVLSRSVEKAPDKPAKRGLIGAVGKKFIQQLVFPLIEPGIGMVGDFFAGKFEAKWRPYRLRTFTPDDYTSAEAGVLVDDATVDREGLARLSGGRALLLLHGTFSRAHSAFGALPREFVETLHRQYEGRVFAFDHHTLSDDPRANVEWLIGHLPPEASLELDLLCHARGGLVGRVLAERQGELAGANGARSLGVGKIVFAGAPNAGTELADPKHLTALIDRYTNLFNLFDVLPIETGVVDVIEMVISVAKQLATGAMKGLDGIRAMVPRGDFQAWLDGRGGPIDTRYYALASDFKPKDPVLGKLVVGKAAERIFKKLGNDLIVPTAGVYDRRRSGVEGRVPQPDRRGGGGAGGPFPIEDRHVFEGDVLAHFGYFSHAEARDKIVGWLAA